MFGLHSLDVGIGLILVYLILSLACTGFNEFVANLTRGRSTTLKEGLARLLEDPTIREKFYNHPLIRSLHRPGQHPSYIPSRAFAVALLDVVAPLATAGPRTLESVTQSLAKLPEGSLKQALLTLAAQGGTELSSLQQNVETWFNDVMDRVSGWYRSKVKYLTAAVAVVLAVGVNADTIRIGTVLANDPERLATVVQKAAEFANAGLPATPEPQPSDSLHPTQPQVTAADLKRSAAEVQARILQLSATGVPLGWAGDTVTGPPLVWVISKLFGLLITAAAISLGAPFWFDILSKAVNIRAGGPNPAPSPKGDIKQ
jgi:hypothetical protein